MISLCPLTVLPCTPLDQIDAAAAAGYDAIGLRLAPSLPTDIEVLRDPRLCAAIEDKLADTGIQVFDIEVARITPGSDLAPLEPLLEFGAKIGAQFIQVTGGPLLDEATEGTARLLEKITALSDRAASHGMGLALEFMTFRSLRDLQQALDLRNMSGRDNVKITLDALHFVRAGGTLRQLETTDPAALACFHVSDAPLEPAPDPAYEARYGRMMPGAGQLPLAAMLNLLPPTLPIGVEVPGSSVAKPLQKAELALAATRSVLSAIGRGAVENF